jgi:hypothetical protein
MFSITNGMKMVWYHLKDDQMIMSLAICSLPAVALLDKAGWKWAAIYELGLLFVFLFVRCFDDPVKLGYEKEEVKNGN